jgi:hypothetical protein
LVIKPKKEKYSQFTREFNEHDIKNFIDDVLGGSAVFKPMMDNLEVNIFSDDL